VGGVEVDNKDRSDQSDNREGNQNLCAALFSFFIPQTPPRTARREQTNPAIVVN
jgi:hypothetical protein